MKSVLVVDDEPQLVRALQVNLEAEGYSVITASDGAEALRAAASQPPDVIVLDLGLPDMDGIEVIRRLRAWTQLPVIVLSARHGSPDKVQALDAGADDYITKPFGLDELLARLRAVERRSWPVRDAATIKVGDLDIDLMAATVFRAGQCIRLTPREWRILQLLVENRGTLVSQQRILNEVWGPTYEKETHYLRIFVSQLRRKLEEDPAKPRHLITEPGRGYRFEV